MQRISRNSVNIVIPGMKRKGMQADEMLLSAF